MSQAESPGARLLGAWRTLSPLPAGRWLFTQLVKWMVPYTGSVSPRVEVLEPGFARISITQRRRLEQHLGSIHAIALMNVAEFASGAAMTTALPAGYRGIVTKMSIEYFKKARGTVTAESRPALPDLTVEGEHDFTSEITDQQGDLIARATVRWKLGPVPAKDAASASAASDAVNDAQATFLRQTGVEVPLIGGPMYPCSNPELVAAVSEAGGIGVVQPVSLTYVYGYEYREGLRYIRRLTSKPIGLNALIEASSKIYFERMVKYIDVALEEGVRFVITSLGNPKWVCERVHAVGGVVYHDVTERKWAQKAIDGGVDGLIAVNNRAGGHAGGLSPAELYESLASFGIPLVSAGGVGTAREFVDDLALGYAAVQLGTRFIATHGVQGKRRVQAGDRRRAGKRHHAHGTPHGRAGRRHRERLHPAPRHEGRADRALDAQGAQDEALDADDLRAQFRAPAEGGDEQEQRRHRVLAGGQERRGHPRRAAGRRHRARVRGGLARRGRRGCAALTTVPLLQSVGSGYFTLSTRMSNTSTASGGITPARLDP